MNAKTGGAQPLSGRSQPPVEGIIDTHAAAKREHPSLNRPVPSRTIDAAYSELSSGIADQKIE
jgi:hypothetical protein